MKPWLLSTLALLSAAAACALLGYLAARAGLPPRATAGHRGRMRRAALRGSRAFRGLEPPIRLGAWLFARAPLSGLRRGVARLAHRAGEPLGLSPDEHLAVCALSGLAWCALTRGLTLDSAAATLAPASAFVVGSLLPLARLHEHARIRKREIERTLPEAIDLASLCMNAGLDFQGSLALLVGVAPARRGHLVVELERVLEALRFGHTRSDALRAFAERVPCPAVQDLVTAVILSEHKGTPLASVLEIQARMLRLRRSILAEELAARAAALLALPLLLLLCSVLLVLVGPFLVGGLGI